MTIAIATLTRRLEWLESRSVGGDDIILNAVLSSLSDDHISLLEEHSVLLEHGFDEETVAVMMEDRYKRFQKAVAAFQERYAAIVEAQKPKPRPPKKTGRRTYTRRVALPKQV